MGNICKCKDKDKNKNKTINISYIDTEIRDKEDKEDNYQFPFKYIVIEGGGVKIIPAAGSVRALYDNGIIENLIKFAGSSAGAILATALACEYSPIEIDNLMLDTDFSKFQDDNIGIARDSYHIIKDYGFCHGDYFENWMENNIKHKLKKSKATFKDLKDIKNKNLYITSLCVDDDKTYIFSYENTPNMVISKAVRMSMSIPFFFKPVKYNNKYYVDGGVSDNYPINIFDEVIDSNENKVDEKIIDKTLGLKLMSKGEVRDGRIFYSKMNTTNIMQFTGSILSHILNHIERKEIDNNYWKRTISINTGDIGTLEFDISKKRRCKYIEMSYTDTLVALEKYKKDKSF